MKYRYLPATVMLSAGAITMFICLYNRYEALYTLKTLLVVLIIFLMIGSLVRRALIKILDMGNELESDDDHNDKADEENVQENTNDSDNDSTIS